MKNLNPSGRHYSDYLSLALLLVWSTGMIFLVEPSPIKTPDSMVAALQWVLNLSEPKSRVAATVVLRGLGVAMIGILLANAMRRYPLRWAGPATIILSPVVAIIVKSMHYGYFPIRIQVLLIVGAALVGAMLGLALQRSRMAFVGLVVFVVSLLVWGVSTGISDDLDRAARATGLHLLAQADHVNSGDEAFTQILELAFAFAEDNSRRGDPVFYNQAAILALGVILGDDQIAQIGGRELDPDFQKERNALRRRVTVHSRSDLPRHFWVSAALTVLSDEDRALAAGIAKEIADSLPGGSGFSFVDMAANQAGIRLAVVATQDVSSARRFQLRTINREKQNQFFPVISGLPENLSDTEFQKEYGGIGGRKSRQFLAEIRQRIEACDGLQ